MAAGGRAHQDPGALNENQRIDEVRQLFDRWAEQGRAEGMEKSHGPSARAAFERLEVGPGQHFLDIGCGNGDRKSVV